MHKWMSQSKLALHTFWVLVGTIFLAEVQVMFMLHAWASTLSPWVEALVDGAVLSLMVMPPLWFWVVRPLARSEEALWREQTAILNASADCIVIVDSAGLIREFNPAGEDMFGYARSEVVSRNVQMLMPEPDRSAHPGYLEDFQRGNGGKVIGRQLQVEALHKDGTVFPIELSKGVCRANGAIRFVGVIRNMTARRALEAERDRAFAELSEHLVSLQQTQVLLEMANLRFAQLYDALPIPCFTFDQEGVIFEVNQEFCRFYGHLAHEVLYRSMAMTVRKDCDEQCMRETIRKVFAGEEMRNVERTDMAADGSEKQVLVSMLPLLGSQGEVCGGIRASVDITQLKRLEGDLRVQLKEVVRAHLKLERANSKLEALATTDAMTGLRNHRFFQETLSGACGSSVRTGRPVSLIMLDVDHFKKYNDSFGHQAGDLVLASVGAILKKGARPSDTGARYGGEEFAVILPETDREAAMQVAERLRTALASAKWRHREITASFGVATSSEGAADAETLVRQADRALYASKEHGRNRCTHSGDSGSAGNNSRNRAA